MPPRGSSLTISPSSSSFASHLENKQTQDLHGVDNSFSMDCSGPIFLRTKATSNPYLVRMVTFLFLAYDLGKETKQIDNQTKLKTL